MWSILPKCSQIFLKDRLVKPSVYMSFVVCWNIKGYKTKNHHKEGLSPHNSKERKRFFQLNKVWPLSFWGLQKDIIFNYLLGFWLEQNGPIPSKRVIRLGTWWKYSLSDTKIIHFSWFSFKQKRMFYFFCYRKQSPVILILFLLSPKVFFQLRSYNLWKIVWICVIIFCLIEISCLNFSNRIFYPDNIL